MTLYTYPARLEADEAGRLVVHFRDLPEALTDGADRAEALKEASDCLSEALAGRISRDEPIPMPSAARRGEHAVAPDPTIALKSALHAVLREEGLKVADLARLLGVEYRLAARLASPRYASKMTSLQEALAALGYDIGIDIRSRRVA